MRFFHTFCCLLIIGLFALTNIFLLHNHATAQNDFNPVVTPVPLTGAQDARTNFRTPRVVPVKPITTNPGPGDDIRNIMVKFREDLRMTMGETGPPVDRAGKGLRSPSALSRMDEMSAAGGSWIRMSGASEEETERLRTTAEQNLNREIGRLNNYFILHVPATADSREWIDALNALDDVEIALFVPRPAPLPVPGSFQGRQGYLTAATNGIDANYAWSLGDSGQNVTICDLEYWWNLSHQDLPSGITTLVPPTWTPLSAFVGDTNHGTAVLGELASMNNGWGTTGAAYGSNIAVAHTNFMTYGWQIGSAMLYAMTQLSPGDVFLVEHQMGGPNYLGIPGNDTGLVPIEWWRPWYDVVVTAVGNGFHVVEAGGNGYQDLDAAVYGMGNGGHWPFLPLNNSGAIIVGAGAAPSSFYGTDTARSRLNFSNYGGRLDLQGWGEFVTTTGYGYLHNSEGINLWYDSTFAGTSSASPIVAAAVALVESRFESVYGGVMAPITMRSILRNTGTAQQSGTNPSSQNIGPLPDLNQALNFGAQTLTAGSYQVGTSRTYTFLTNVAADLSQKIVTGNITFELMSDYVSAGEIYPIVFNEYTTAGGNWNVTIRPALGVIARNTIGAPPPYQPLIHLNGADRMTFDGRPGGVGSGGDWLLRNTRTDSTGPAILLSTGADDNTLEYLEVESGCVTPGYGTLTFGRPSDSLGNRRNLVSYNQIQDRSDIPGIHAIGVIANWFQSFPNDSNTLVGNHVMNWSSIGASLNGERWTVDSNSFYGIHPLSNMATGIWMTSGNAHRIRDNHIGGSSPGSVGAPLPIIVNSPFTGISLTIDTLAQTDIERNIVRNIMSASTGFGSFVGIACYTQGRVRIADNVIGDVVPPMGVWLSGTGFGAGIDIALVQGAEIEGNTILNIRQSFTTPGSLRGISVYSPNTIKIKKNLIHSLGPTKPGVPGLVSGIYLDQLIDSVVIKNNMIALGFGDTNDCIYIGINDNSQFGVLGVDVLNNSIAVGGISSGVANSVGLDHPGFSFIAVKNNAINNLRSGGSGSHFTMSNNTPSWLPGASDNNVLNNLNPAVLTRWIGSSFALPAWIGSSFGDFLSINADPVFTGPPTGDLHIDPTVWSPVDNAGVPLAVVTDDFDGNVRGGAPDIGADEYTIASPGPFALTSPPDTSTNRPVSDTLRWGASPAAGFYDVYLDSMTPPTTLLSGNLTDTLCPYGPLDSNMTWYWSVTSKNSSAGVAASGAPWSFTTGVASGMISRSYAHDSSWNMLSVPLDVADFSKSGLFPLATSNAFGYDGSYMVRDTLAVGPGFWIKFADTGHVAMTGYSVDPETVDVSNGWNIIGSISDRVTVSSITSVPGAIVTSSFYGYANGYFTADTIDPGRSYWVKVSQSGKVILTTDTTGMVPTARIRITPIAEVPPPPPGDPVTAGRAGADIPAEFGLDQNFPNPFNPSTEIGYSVARRGHVTLSIHDLLGREVSTLIDEVVPAGSYVVRWDAQALPGGVYFYRLETEGFRETGKMVLVK